MDDAEPEPPVPDPERLDAPLDSVAIRRIIEEVHNNTPRAYDRTYNRHNRS